MVTITLKNIPVFLHRQLKQRAVLHHRSLNSEILQFLLSSVGSSPVDVDSLLDRARCLRKRVSGELTPQQWRTFRDEGRS